MLPFSPLFSKTNAHYQFPLHATLLSMTFCAFFGLLYLASAVAIGSIITSAKLYLVSFCYPPLYSVLPLKFFIHGPHESLFFPSQNITYAVPQAILAVRGRHPLLHKRRSFSLGRYGYICNTFAPIWVTIVGIFFCFPARFTGRGGAVKYMCQISDIYWRFVLT